MVRLYPEPNCPACGGDHVRIRPNYAKEWESISFAIGRENSAGLFYECYACKQLFHKWQEGTELHAAAERAWALAGRTGMPYVPQSDRG